MTRTRNPVPPAPHRTRPRTPATSRAGGAAARSHRPAGRTADRERGASNRVAALADRRLAACSIALLVVFVVLAGRVAWLQVGSGDRYKDRIAAQTLKTVPISGERGTVFDRNGRDLALSIRRPTVYADPKLVTDPVVAAAKLAPVLGVDQGFLLQQMSQKGSRFAYLAHTVDDQTATKVKELDLPGIGFTEESARAYPANGLASVLLGKVGTEGKGLNGIEYNYDAELSGEQGELVVEQDPNGRDIPGTERTRTEASRGNDIMLTIDQDVQWAVERSLVDQVRATQAKGGMAAIVDVATGDVVAMASAVGASKDSAARVAGADDRNAPLTELFAPGSTAKLITLSWAMENNRIGPDTSFTVPDWISIDPKLPPFKDSEEHPVEQMTTADILRLSSNVGTIKIAQKLTNDELATGVRAFGLGRATPIAWAGQPEGLLLDPKEYYATGKAATSIGYGIAVTGMQMLNVFTTIANGGESREPRLVSGVIDADGQLRPTAVPPGRRVVSPETAATMTRLMQGVVGSGTGTCAAVRGYTVAGKTGTSKKLMSSGQYSDSSTMASFIGFAPAEKPRFAAMVVVDEPSFSYQYGGAAAAPVWSEIMQFALGKYLVAPTDPEGAQYEQARKAAKYPCAVPHGDEATARATGTGSGGTGATTPAATKPTTPRTPTAATKAGTGTGPAPTKNPPKVVTAPGAPKAAGNLRTDPTTSK